jgi:ATP-dependent protease ClpP protease subunit
MFKLMPAIKKIKELKHVDNDPLEDLKDLLPKSNEIEKQNNHIYFYKDVNTESCLELNKKIIELNKELLKYSIDYDCSPPNIYLHINSNGGELFAAFSTVDTIKNSKIPIISIIEGAAASAATIIAMVCHKRYITPSSFMLIHQLSSGLYGKYEEMIDDFNNSTKLMNLLYNLYENYTSMELKDIKKILKRDMWITAEDCLDIGIVDDIWRSSGTNLSIKDEFSSVVRTTTEIETFKDLNKSNIRKRPFSLLDSLEEVEIVTKKKTQSKKSKK